MFTGIIQETGILKRRIRGGRGYKLLITDCQSILTDIDNGDSIAVNGVCLTVVDYTGDSFTADIMPATLRATNMGSLKTGTAVNLEPAVKADGFFGGHFVTGHVDGTGRVRNIIKDSNAARIEINASSELLKYMVDKGSLTVNGVSLTIIRVKEESFVISLIPETRHSTSLNQLEKGDKVNIETDIIGKYVAKMIGECGNQVEGDSVINKRFLQENGFI